jgi:DNA-binding CsgD family transcriptional regulator
VPREFTPEERTRAIDSRREEAHRMIVQIVLGYAADRSSERIARDLDITPSSIEGRLSRAYDQYGVRSRIALLVVMLRQGHITPAMIKNLQFAQPRKS